MLAIHRLHVATLKLELGLFAFFKLPAASYFFSDVATVLRTGAPEMATYNLLEWILILAMVYLLQLPVRLYYWKRHFAQQRKRRSWRTDH